MKRLTKVLLIGSLLLMCLPAWAAHSENGTAKVVEAIPVYTKDRYPVDERVCWDEQTWRRDPVRHSPTPSIIGRS